MKSKPLSRRLPALLLVLTLLAGAVTPASAFFLKKDTPAPVVLDFAKNGQAGTILCFYPEDFKVQASDKSRLNAITIQTLPDAGAGTLTMGGTPVEEGTVVDQTALGGLRFESQANPTVLKTTFTFHPSFSSGRETQDTTVTLVLLKEDNAPPVARNMDLSTYRNIAVTGYFDAVDSEGEPLAFQVTSIPARGSVTLSEDGSSMFVYTPYENKTGRDTFTYVAVDPAGNTSPEATISVRIEKADTKVTYADMNGHPACAASIRLAEDGIFTGEYVNGRYFFRPDTPVSRAEFLTMAMAAAGLEPLEQVTSTGFVDDDDIPSWARGAVSAAVKAGVVNGTRDASGAPVFDANSPITRDQAVVLLNNLLDITDVPAEVFFDGEPTHWASQAAANLAASGVIRAEDAGPATFSNVVTRAETAEMLSGAMDMLEARASSGFFPWLFG